MTSMDEGSKAIVREISRDIIFFYTEKIEKITEKNNLYLDNKFLLLGNKIEEIGKELLIINRNGCSSFIKHEIEHKEKEKKAIKLVTLISVSIPTIIMLGAWIKGIIIGWIQRPPNMPHG